MGLKDVDVWLGLSKSGKGFSVRIENDYYIGSVANLNAVLNGEKKGVKLSLQVPDEKKEA